MLHVTLAAILCAEAFDAHPSFDYQYRIAILPGRVSHGARQAVTSCHVTSPLILTVLLEYCKDQRSRYIVIVALVIFIYIYMYSR